MRKKNNFRESFLRKFLLKKNWVGVYYTLYSLCIIKETLRKKAVGSIVRLRLIPIFTKVSLHGSI